LPLTERECEQIRQEVADLLAPVAEKHGICLDCVMEACAKEGDLLAIRARFSLPERPESVATLKEEMDFKCYAEGYGMQDSWLGQEFKRGNFTFRVAGLKIGDPEKCVVLQRSDGARSQENGKLVARYLG
jgi:hypothetical protein